MEYFNAINRDPLTTRWGCGDSLEAYVHALRAHRTSPNGVFGAKMHWDQLELIWAESLDRPPRELPFTLDSGFLDSLFPGARHLYIRRLDVNRQAVSRWIAAQSEVWEVGREDPYPRRTAVHYSFTGIERYRRHVALGDLHWDRYFHVNGIEPKEVWYEDLADDYEGVLRDVLSHLVPGSETIDIAPAETRRPGGALTAAFTERFVSDLVRRGIEGPNISERLSDRAHRAADLVTRGLHIPEA